MEMLPFYKVLGALERVYIVEGSFLSFSREDKCKGRQIVVVSCIHRIVWDECIWTKTSEVTSDTRLCVGIFIHLVWEGPLHYLPPPPPPSYPFPRLRNHSFQSFYFEFHDAPFLNIKWSIFIRRSCMQWKISR